GPDRKERDFARQTIIRIPFGFNGFGKLCPLGSGLGGRSSGSKVHVIDYLPRRGRYGHRVEAFPRGGRAASARRLRFVPGPQGIEAAKLGTATRSALLD